MTQTISDLLKEAVFVTVVPDASPDADGERVVMGVSAHRLRPRTDWNYLRSICPPGHHPVKVES